MSGHFHKPEFGDFTCPGPGAVAAQRLAKFFLDLSPVVQEHHVNEVDDDDSTHIPEPELPGDFPGGFHIYLEDRFFLIVAPDISTAIDVDSNQGFGMVNDQVASPPKPRAPFSRLLDFFLYTKGVEYKIATKFDKTKVIKWEKKEIGDAYEALRVKIVELLGSEGPKTDEELAHRLPIPKSQITLILHELEIKNVVSVGFFRQTNDAEFILRVDEHKITGGSEDVVDYRELQNFILNKSFRKMQKI